MHVTNETLAAAQAALDADPTNAALHTELGMALFHLDRYGEALRAFQQALVINPDLAEAHNGVGRVHYHLGPPEAAIAAYTRAITIDPHYIPGYWGLGILYYAQLGRYDDALAIFRRGLEANPQEGAFYEGIGHAHARAGRFEEAVTTFKMAARLDLANPSGDCNLAIVYLATGRYHEALAAMQRAIAIAPDHGWQHRVLGFVYDRLGDTTAALAASERAVALEPDDYEDRAGLARTYRVAGRGAEAAEQEAIGRRLAASADEYGRACLESVLGNQHEAVALLGAALAKGQLTVGWARIDPEFVFLQDNPGYQALLGD